MEIKIFLNDLASFLKSQVGLVTDGGIDPAKMGKTIKFVIMS